MDRKAMIRRRMELDPSERKSKEEAIVETLLPFLKGNVGAYIPVRGEADVFSSLKDRTNLFLPRVIDEEEMEFILYYKEKMVKGAFGIPEPQGTPVLPESLDTIIVPMVAFCQRARKGYGKGYYDRYLKKTRALKIGVAFDLQEDLFFCEEHDVLMDIVITESRIIQGGTA